MKSIFLFLTVVYFSPIIAQEKDPHFTKSIFFGGGNYYIDHQQIQELNIWLDGFPGLEGYDILIHSHTDDIGSLDYNQKLSQMRTQAVIRVLEKEGFGPRQFQKKILAN